ncbi:hypothetical protein R3P38DRAFT_3116770 [Favolaschia claudopus]|uniref:Uncharacterized protein n=1 Tax=Favolaschia claudopus TaxID=2862362 RepID=A0AAV9ZEY0_9AGAR
MKLKLTEDLIQPFLPPELERATFEEAALSCFGHIPTLMLTAWRVKHRVEPFLYRVAFTKSPTRRPTRDPELKSYVAREIFLQKLDGQSSVEVALAVRHLFCDLGAQDLKTTLIACNGITDLYILGVVKNDILPILEGLQNLRRLTMVMQTLLEPKSMQLGYEFYTRLTHLELLACEFYGSSDLNLTGLDFFSNLTHIAFNLDDPNGAAAVHDRIRRDSKLQCIVFFEPVDPIREALDDRFVVIRQTDYAEEWLRGAIVGKDYWWLAKQFLAAKRAGDVDRTLCYRITDNAGVSWECETPDGQ